MECFIMRLTLTISLLMSASIEMRKDTQLCA